MKFERCPSSRKSLASRSLARRRLFIARENFADEAGADGALLIELPRTMRLSGRYSFRRLLGQFAASASPRQRQGET